MSLPGMSPGSLALEYAKRKGWDLKKRNIMLEGDSDVSYFELASKLHFMDTNLKLIGEDLSIFSPGSGDRGGTKGIFEQYPPLIDIIKVDPDQNGKMLFRVIALIDNDYAGRMLHKSLSHQYRYLRNNCHIFILQRNFPRTTSEPNALTNQIEQYNSTWKCLDTEIEDLFDNELVEAFMHEYPNACIKPYIEVCGQRHYDFTTEAKSKLVRFVRDYATLRDVAMLIDIIKSLRFYLGLPADGVK